MSGPSNARDPTPVPSPLMKESARRMWEKYCIDADLGADAPLPPVWHFCDTQADADECARLVLAGRKRATAPSLWGLRHRGETVPTVGSLDVVTTWEGEACAIIKTSRVVILPFSSVPVEHAAAEGEGDGSLTWWRRAHREYYARELVGTPYVLSDNMPVVCQYFDVVYPDLS
jgi:uncharacterized protein YhfF